MLCYVCWEVTSLFIRSYNGAFRHYHQNRGKRRRAAVSRSAWRAPWAPGSGDQRVDSYRHLSSRASGAGCPFPIRAERNVSTGAANSSSEPDPTLKVPSRGWQKQQQKRARPVWAGWWPSRSCRQFPAGPFRLWAGHEHRGRRTRNRYAGNKGRKMCQAEVAFPVRCGHQGIERDGGLSGPHRNQSSDPIQSIQSSPPSPLKLCRLWSGTRYQVPGTGTRTNTKVIMTAAWRSVRPAERACWSGLLWVWGLGLFVCLR